MEINKQLFEDILSGRLRGTFILKNGKKFNDRFLTDIYKCTVVLCKTTYYFNGKPIVSGYNGVLDIVDFIPDTDMETKELKIQIPEGQEIDWQESAKQEKIVFKKIDTKPRSWEEYCNNYIGKVFYIDKNSAICGGHDVCGGLYAEVDKNTLPSEELARAFRAMMQLMSLRQDWIHKWSLERGLTKDWEPDWNNKKLIKWCIEQIMYKFYVYGYNTGNKVLSFPTQEITIDFMNCFKDLLEVAKPLV